MNFALASDPQSEGVSSCGGRSVNYNGGITVGVVRECGGRRARPSKHVENIVSFAIGERERLSL